MALTTFFYLKEELFLHFLYYFTLQIFLMQITCTPYSTPCADNACGDRMLQYIYYHNFVPV